MVKKTTKEAIEEKDLETPVTPSEPIIPQAKESDVPSSAEVKARIIGKAAQMKDQLEKQEQVTFMIPLREGESPNAVQPVTINGYRMVFPKGKMIKVPMAVLEILADRYNIEVTAGRDKLISRSEDIQKAFS